MTNEMALQYAIDKLLLDCKSLACINKSDPIFQSILETIITLEKIKIKKEVKINSWIKVTEKNPPNNKYIVVLIENLNPKLGKFIEHEDLSRKKIRSFYSSIEEFNYPEEDIIHYITLPELPKE